MIDKSKAEQFLLDDLKNKQRYIPLPAKMDRLVSELLTRRGYARVKAASQLADVWGDVVGERMAGMTIAGTIRRGMLEVTCKNSAVMQELAFKKHSLVTELNQKMGSQANQQIQDLKLRVAAT
jgi:predicted nucleic acid-binding Zn ribbon protein|tara:strand:+ start:2527 stop:2895 length:369 start_codon:yes stop_codon:yes gene_type:complete